MRLNVEGKPFVTLGAATVGQAVRCTFMNNQGGTVDVIVKILRPGVKERFEEDVKIFDAVAFKNAEKDDVNRQHDGHTKVRTNKL